MSAPEPTGFDAATFDKWLALRTVVDGTNDVIRSLAGLIAAHGGLVEPGGRIDFSNRDRLATACDGLARTLANLPVSLGEYEMRLIKVPEEEARRRRAFHTAGHVVVARELGLKIEAVNLSGEPERIPAEDIEWGAAGRTLLTVPIPRPPDRHRIDLQPRGMQMTTILLAGYWAEFLAAPEAVPYSFTADFAGARRLAGLYADERKEADWLAEGDRSAAHLVSESWVAVVEEAARLLDQGSVPFSSALPGTQGDACN